MEQGCIVRVQYGEEVLEGTFISEKPHFTLKLDSGYNLVLDQKRIKDIKVVSPPKKKGDRGEGKKEGGAEGKETKSRNKEGHEKESHAKELGKDSQGKRISILHLGGTVASKIDYSTGAVIAQFSPEDIVRLYPEITEIAQISSRLIRNMQSEMIRFAHYNIIAQAISEEVEKGCQGIIITHGTDELHYTSAAITFMFDSLPVPVVFVASQRSSDRPSSDARQNLVAGVIYASHADPGVYLCLHEGTDDDSCIILPGLKSRKFHTTRRDAFKPVNASPIARVSLEKRTIERIAPQDHKTPHPPSAHPSFKKFNEHLKVGLIKARPMMYADELLFFKDYDGLVLEGLGIGHMPTEKIDEFTAENEKIYTAIKHLCQKMPVALTSQCIYGRINMNIYTPGRELLEAGVLGNGLDMTPETAYIKLAWLLSTAKKEDVPRLYQENLRGEITERTEEDH